MTDLLAERFAALADTRDDSDWLDVRRRARRKRLRVAAPVAVVAAAACAATAVAATSGWLFSRSGPGVQAVTHVAFHGSTWTVDVSETTITRYGFCASLRRGSGPTTYTGCGIYLIPLPALPKHIRFPPKQLVVTSSFPRPPFGALRHADGAGELWFGVARKDVATIVMTDKRGHRHTAATVAAPASLKTTTRFWVVAIPSSHAGVIAGYDAHGRLIKLTGLPVRSGLLWIH